MTPCIAVGWVCFVCLYRVFTPEGGTVSGFAIAQDFSPVTFKHPSWELLMFRAPEEAGLKYLTLRVQDK